MTPASDLARFWTHVDRSDPDGCWPWTAGHDPDGYGHFWAQGKTHRASRWILDQHVGLAPRQQARHTCDNPPCCRLDHLIPGSPRQNTRDMLSRGRRPATLIPPHRPGMANNTTKLTDDQVRAIRSEYATGKVRQVDLASKYGVTQASISRITRGAGWTHLT